MRAICAGLLFFCVCFCTQETGLRAAANNASNGGAGVARSGMSAGAGGASPFGTANRKSKFSDKLKLTSVAKISGVWHFGVWDGSTDKTYWVKLGAPRTYGGVSVDAYNENTFTALVTTQNGRFVVVMKEPSGGVIEQKVISANDDIDSVREKMSEAIDGYSGSRTTYTRSDVLNLIKPKP